MTNLRQITVEQAGGAWDDVPFDALVTLQSPSRGTGKIPMAKLSSREIPPNVPFIPSQTRWLFELTCSSAGSAVVTLSGVRRTDGVTEDVWTYSLVASEYVLDENSRIDHSSFIWTKTGLGFITAKEV